MSSSDGLRERAGKGEAPAATKDVAAAAAGGGDGKPAGKMAGRRRHKVYKAVPWLDKLLTAVFALETFASFWVFRQSDYLMSFCVALCMTAVAVVVVKKSSVLFGIAVADSGLLAHNKIKDKPRTRKKFAEQSWQLAVHVSLAALDWYVIEEAWWNTPSTIFLPTPTTQVHSPAIRLLYITQLGVWIYTCFIHRFVDARRKDYFVMYAHHVVTIALVVGSAAGSYYRIGVLVLLVHDISDITVDLLKLFNYLDISGARHLFLTEIIFIINLGMWIYWRLYQFPARIMYATLIVLFQTLSKDPNGPKPWEDPLNADTPDMYWWGNLMLVILLTLHTWWFWLFLKLLYGLLTTDAHESGRENYEGDSTDEEEGNIGGEDILPLWFCTMALPVLVYAQVHLLRSFPEQ